MGQKDQFESDASKVSKDSKASKASKADLEFVGESDPPGLVRTHDDLADPAFEAIVARAKQQNALGQKLMDARRARAQEVARNIAQAIGLADPGVLGVWGFGSVFETWRRFRLDSDIDLALEGGNWFKAYSLAEHREFEINLIDLADVTPAFADSVRKQGVILYEKL